MKLKWWYVQFVVGRQVHRASIGPEREAIRERDRLIAAGYQAETGWVWT